MNLTIACLKYGKKYSAEYVNILRAMTKRHLSLPHTFICFTEDPEGIDPEIKTYPLPDMGLEAPNKAWWYKLKVFDPSLGLKGTLLFLDLDVVIISSIDKLFEYKPGKFCIIQDFLRVRYPDYSVRNSSVFRLEVGSYPDIWNEFVQSKEKIISSFHGDQDWITKCINDEELWPHDWIISYGWELKKRLSADEADFLSYEEHTDPPKDCAIIVFHGSPNPHDVAQAKKPDPIIKKYWH